MRRRENRLNFCVGDIDVDAAFAAWKLALEAPVWQGSPFWIHGDLVPSNLLVNEGQLSSVIDWGGMGVGDPACDVMAAWTCLTTDTRKAFRAAVNVDDTMWIRGSGWALSFGVICLPYYVDRNPVLASIGRHAINEVLADYGKGF